MAISAATTTLGEAPPPQRRRLLEDERWLAFVEARDNLFFPELDYRVYRPA